MILKNTISIISTIIILILIINTSCKYDNYEARFDKELFQMLKNTNDFVWYKYSSSSLNKSIGSGHEQPLLKTKYNTIAATMLDSFGKVKINSNFPEGSIIVKELLDMDEKLEVYALLFKNKNHPNADAKGWVWGYYKSNGSVLNSSSLKGKDCRGCHSQVGNEDYMLMNKYYP